MIKKKKKIIELAYLLKINSNNNVKSLFYKFIESI